MKNAIAIAVLATTMVACGGGAGGNSFEPTGPAIIDTKPAPDITCGEWVDNGDGTESRQCVKSLNGESQSKYTETRDIEEPPVEPTDEWPLTYGEYQIRTSCDLYGFCASPVEVEVYGYGDTVISMYDEQEAHRNIVVDRFINHTSMVFDQEINRLEVGQYSDFYEVRGHEGIGLSVKYGGTLEHLMATEGEFSIITSSMDDSPERNEQTRGQYTDIDGYLWKPAAILMSEILDSSPALFVTSMENSDVSECASAKTDTGINLCGEWDTYIAHSGVALDQTLYVSNTYYGQEGAGIHEGHIIVVDGDVVRRGYTSHAAPFVGALAGQVADHFGLTNPAEVKAKMFEFVVDGVLDHNAILAL